VVTVPEVLLVQLIASVRVVSWLVLVPPFSTRAVPPTVRVGVAVALSFVVAPMVDEGQVPATVPGLVVAVVGQVAIGAGLGWVTMLLFQAITAAGALIDTFGGFSLAQAFDPLSQNMNTVFGQLHQMLATMLLFATGAHLVVIGGLLRTFDVLPVGDLPRLPPVESVVTSAFTLFFVTAVQIALPMVAVLFIADLGLALLTKVAPQLNAINVMFPAKIGLTLLLVGMTFPALSGAVGRLTDAAIEAMSVMVGAG
jgi:flagellar biosynthetic protein FliR